MLSLKECGFVFVYAHITRDYMYLICTFCLWTANRIYAD